MKNLNLIVTLAIVIILAVGGITVVSSYFSYNNKEISLREQAEAQRGKVEGVHDAMWKIISQKAQISDQYREGFDSIYTHIIEGRYSKGDGTLMKWIRSPILTSILACTRMSWTPWKFRERSS